MSRKEAPSVAAREGKKKRDHRANQVNQGKGATGARLVAHGRGGVPSSPASVRSLHKWALCRSKKNNTCRGVKERGKEGRGIRQKSCPDEAG